MKNPFTFAKQSVANTVARLRQKLLVHLAKEENMQLLPADFPVGQVNLMGCAVLYYESRGFKHFVTLRKEDQQGDRTNRLPGYMTLPLHEETHQPMDALHALHEALERQLGVNFCKRASLKKRLRHDSVMAVPMFMRQGNQGEKPQAPLQTFVWALPIQKKQLKTIQVPDGVILETVPQFAALKGKRLQPLHQALLHSLSHYFAKQPLMVASEKELKKTLQAVAEYHTQHPTVH